MSDLLTHISFFSGIGGMDLAAERAGFKTIAQIEKDPFCNQVLKKNFGNIPRWRDINNVTSEDLIRVVGRPTVISGGFPCQDISIAGKREGIFAGRSGLVWNFLSIVGEVRPKYIIIENVYAWKRSGLINVLSRLAGIGYNAEWCTISASSRGYPHKRRRIFLIAYSDSKRKQRIFQTEIPTFKKLSWLEDVRSVEDLRNRSNIPEPLIRGTCDGIPYWMDRLRTLGNSVVPDAVYPIFKSIAEIEGP